MEQLDFDRLAEFVSENKSKAVALTFHSVGDTDSVASSMALSYCMENSTVVAPDQITTNARATLSKCGFSSEEIKSEIPEGTELVVLLDVNNLEDCGPLGTKISDLNVPILVIDHHAPSKIEAERVLVFNDEGYNSASSIVYELMTEQGEEIDANMAKLLAMGIISDSAEFKNSTALTFSQLGELFSIADTDYMSMLHEFVHIAEPEVRAKTIRNLFGSAVEVREGLVFVHGATATHASVAADDAIRIGADLAVFVTEDAKELKMSARLRPTLDTEYGVHLGIIMKRVGKLIDGTGGGHPCAAGAYGQGRANAGEAVNFILDEVANAATLHGKRAIA